MIVVTDNGPVEVPTTTVRRAKRVEPTFGFTWVGTDGKEWDLCGPGPVYILSGARGFGMPTPQHWFRQNLGDGASHNGLRIPPREVRMPVEVETRDWLDADRAFFAGMDMRKEGRLRVTTPAGTSREIRCRYAEGAEGELETDPHLTGRQPYDIRFIAADPYWYGERVTETFKYAAPAPLFPGPPFRIMPAQMLGASTIVNLGDAPARGLWRVTGPFTGFSVGVGSALVNMTVTKPAGGWVEIDMGTSTRMYDETGADMWERANDFNFADLPPGEADLTTAVTGAGVGTEVSVSFVPRFYRAW